MSREPTLDELDLLNVLDSYLVENYGNVSPKLRNQHRGEINSFLKFLGRPATADDMSHRTTMAFRDWLACKGYSHPTVRQYFQWIRRLWMYLHDQGVIAERPPVMGRNAGIIGLCDAPILPSLIEVQQAEALREFRETPLQPPVNTFGVSDSDVAYSLQSQLEQAEATAWSMLRVCPQCERRFLPAKVNSDCCSRPCYLKFYRKKEAKRYAGYMKKSRGKN